MKKIRTRQFFKTLYTSMGIGGAFLLFMLIFGRSIAANNFDVLLGCVFAVLGLAALSFLVFCFVPYFRGDNRWYSVSSILTLAFCIGSAVLWQMSGAVAI